MARHNVADSDRSDEDTGVGPDAGAAARRPDWAGGVRAGRRYLARAVVWAAMLVALALGLAAVLRGFGANEHNILVRGCVSAAEHLDGPFGDLFTFGDQVKQSIVNWVIAAVAYLAVGGILARLIRP